MEENKIKELQEKLNQLTLLLDFHSRIKEIIWMGREKEFQIYIDEILDTMIETKKELEILFNKK